MSTSSNTFQAAVMRQKGGPLQRENVKLDSPQHGEVLVRIVATGMCHTDMVARDQIFPLPQPVVLGHEGAGVAEAAGPGVRKVAAGDHVVLTFLSCGQCRACQEGAPAGCERFNDLNFSGHRHDGSHALHDHADHPLNDRFFGQSSFGAYAIANERNVVKVRNDAPLELLGPLGCGVQTGAGAALNALKVSAGSSLAAFGSGAVELSAILAARAVGATTRVVDSGSLTYRRYRGHTLTVQDTNPVSRRSAWHPGAKYMSSPLAARGSSISATHEDKPYADQYLARRP